MNYLCCILCRHAKPHGIYYCKTKEITSTLRTSGFDIKREYLTSLSKLRVDDLNVWFVVLVFQKNTNEQAQSYYHFILRMRISQTLSNSNHNFGHRRSMNIFKKHATVCNKRWNDIGTAMAIIRRTRTRQFSHLSIVKVRATMCHFKSYINDIYRPFSKIFCVFPVRQNVWF